MSGKAVARVLIAVLVGVALGGIAVLISRPGVEVPPLPAPPIITAARGDLPGGIIAFEERVKWGDGYGLSGSGFFLGLANGDVIGVTTAHSLGEGKFTRIIFALPGQEQQAAWAMGAAGSAD